MKQKGVYCSKCGEKHPTYNWHEPYDSYSAESVVKPRIERDVLKAFPGKSKTELETIFKKTREHKIYAETVVKGKCVICGSTTFFKNKATGHYTCSDKCLYKDSAPLRKGAKP